MHSRCFFPAPSCILLCTPLPVFSGQGQDSYAATSQCPLKLPDSDPGKIDVFRDRDDKIRYPGRS